MTKIENKIASVQNKKKSFIYSIVELTNKGMNLVDGSRV